MKPETKSSLSPEALRRLAGTDTIVAMMVELNIPVTRESYLDRAYPPNGPDPEEWGAELESMLPEELQRPLPFRRT